MELGEQHFTSKWLEDQKREWTVANGWCFPTAEVVFGVHHLRVWVNLITNRTAQGLVQVDFWLFLRGHAKLSGVLQTIFYVLF